MHLGTGRSQGGPALRASMFITGYIGYIYVCVLYKLGEQEQSAEAVYESHLPSHTTLLMRASWI
jgi:hypothetical protein